MNSKPRSRLTDSPPASTANVDAAAADWLARHDAGLEAVEQAQFQQWLTADSRHAAAWREIESAWRVFDRPQRRGDAGRMIRELTVRRRRRRQRILIGSMAVIVIATTTTVFVSQQFSPLKMRPAEMTRASSIVVSKPERRQLVDGSVVDLNTGAQIEVNFSAARRDVTLLKGEAHFSVAKDASRPFVVATTVGEVRAVGTAFSVGLLSESMAILVTEGAVAVERPAVAPHQPVPVPAGNALVVSAVAAPDSALRVEPVAPAEMERRLAWRVPRIELSNTPVADVVAVFNRENRTRLAIADVALARLRLTGVFRADRPEEFVRLLEAHYRVHAERRGSNAILLHLEQ